VPKSIKRTPNDQRKSDGIARAVLVRKATDDGRACGARSADKAKKSGGLRAPVIGRLFKQEDQSRPERAEATEGGASKESGFAKRRVLADEMDR
jgi:hypothetical protein